MKLADPAVPEGWQLQRLEDGSVRAAITRHPTGWAAGLLAATAIPFFALLTSLARSGFLMWLIAITPLVVVLVHLVDRVVHGALGTEAWHLSKSGLNIRRALIGMTWWNVDYFHGTLSVASEEGATWELRFQQDGDLYSLFRSDTLDDVLGLAAFLDVEIGWPLSVSDSNPQILRQVVENAVTQHNPDRIRLLLQYEPLVPVLAGHWGPLYWPRLREILTALEAESGILSDIAERAGPAARAAAVTLLGALDDARSLPVLRRALNDPAGQVRVRAAEALGHLRDAEAVPALVASLQYAPDLRDAAVRALGEIGNSSGVEALRELVVGTARVAQVDCRISVIRALGQIKVPAVLPTLVEAMQDTSPEVREVTAEVLGAVGGGGAVPALAAALMDPAPQVALQAAMSLGRLGDRSSFRALADALTTDRVELRAHAARALASIGDGPAVQELCRALDDAAGPVRYEAAAGLLRIVQSGHAVPIQVRVALPLLRRLGSPLSTEAADVKHACREAVRQIERATARMKQLPVPANRDAITPALLPVPVHASGLDAAGEAPELLDGPVRSPDGCR